MSDDRTTEAMAATLREAGWIVIPPDRAKLIRDCQFCATPEQGGDCICLDPCGAPYCWWAENQVDQATPRHRPHRRGTGARERPATADRLP